MTTQDKKDSVHAKDDVAKKPRKPRTKNVDTTVPEVDVTEVNFIGVKHHDLKEFMNSLVSVTGKEFVKVSCHSKPDMVDAGYSVITTNVFNTVKDALVNNHNVYYRDVGAKVDSINYGGIDADNVEGGIAYILTGAATHLCFIISAGQNKVVLPDADVKYVVDAIAHALGYTLDAVKQKMINAFLEQSKNMEPEQETDTANGVEVTIVEPAKQFHDETQFVLRAVDKGITENPGLEVVYMQIQGDTPNLQYSVMFTNQFDTLVNVLISGANTKFTECRTACPTSCGIGGVVGYDDDGDYKEYYFFVIDLGNKFSPATFNDHAFLKQTFTYVKWAFETVERYRARHIYQSEDKGIDTVEENQVQVNETQDNVIPEETLNLAKRHDMVDAIMGAIGTIQPTVPMIDINLCINQDINLAEQGYNALFTNDFFAVVDRINESKDLACVQFQVGTPRAAYAGVYVNSKLIFFYIVEELDDVAGMPDVNLTTTVNELLEMGACHSKFVEDIKQKLGVKYVATTVEEIDESEANDSNGDAKVKASGVRVTVGRRQEQMPEEPIADSKQFPPFKAPVKKSIADYLDSKLDSMYGGPRLGCRNSVFDPARYNRFTYPNQMSEQFDDVRIYCHPAHVFVDQAYVESMLGNFKRHTNMASIPTRDSLGDINGEFTRDLCRLENGSVVWNRAALLTLPSCRQNKKDFKGINHYMLAIRDSGRRDFVICIYADHTSRKRPNYVVNFFEVLEGNTKPYEGDVRQRIEHTLRS